MGLRSIVRVRYVDDAGTPRVFKQQEQARAAAGNTVADGTEIPMSADLQPRYILASWFSAGGAGQAVGKFSRKIVIGSVANPLWTHADQAISMADMESTPGAGQTTPNVMREFQVTGRVGEQETY